MKKYYLKCIETCPICKGIKSVQKIKHGPYKPCTACNKDGKVESWVDIKEVLNNHNHDYHDSHQFSG